jgi:DNA replication protein DnaC
MTTPATPEASLIPEGILTAVQTLAGTSAIALVNTGDRSLNAAISAFITTIVVYIIEKIKKFKKWSEFNELWEKLIDDLPIWKKTKKEEKVIDPLDVSGAPKHPDEFVFKFAFDFDRSQYLELIEWIYSHHHCCAEIFKINQNENGIYTQTGDSFRGAAMMSSNYCAIYRCPTTKEYIYYKQKSDEIKIRHLYVCCNHKSSLDDFISLLNDWTRTRRSTKSCLKNYIIRMRSNGEIFRTEKKVLSKTFDGIFFEQKDQLLALLQKFKDGTMYPSHLMEDNKLGILMYGPPGTGKSICMSAISNFLKRDFMPVSSQIMRNRGMMDLIFDSRNVVIAFDEFDCLLDVVGKRGEEREVDDDEKQSRREINTHSHKAVMAAKLFAAALEEKDDAKKAQMMAEYDKLSNSSTDKVDMAYLLSKFQGYESAEGRCVVASTNNPHLIDDALKRKGRFDLVLHLDNATPKMILDIVNYYYQTGADEVAELEEAFMDLLPLRVISPACVQDMAMNCSSARETLERLIPKRR